MIYLIAFLSAFFASFITFFSGFGLGTLILPLFALFLPLPSAIALQAAVHLFHSLLKAFILRKSIDWAIVWRFGVPALLAAIPGAFLLKALAGWDYPIGQTTPLKITIALLLLIFALLECRGEKGERRSLLWGGLLSGFFGGLSGNQGALRSLFLVSEGISKEAFIATSGAIAVFVDAVRLFIYSMTMGAIPPLLMGIPMLGVLAGVLLGNAFLPRVTLRWIQRLVVLLLILFALLLALGKI